MAFAEGYIDVASRIVEFREKFPEGSLQPADPQTPFRVEKIGDQTFIVVVAAAFRNPEDPRPGMGMAYEQFPGRTPYTRGSELQNAETSAWGRAIVAALAADTRQGIASQEEVRNRQAEREQPVSAPSERVATANRLRGDIAELCKQKTWDVEYAQAVFKQRMHKATGDASVAELAEFLQLLKTSGMPTLEEETARA
ncbi:hypothetical protein VSH64_25025 [Amycolatopsis rhabdoformis]|uniref:Uncharacterized protein n=1 Tax=Amycolatopsis rhabdoformis TaxID=1448059 RepID=A0ABZ1HX91_9PSEU|nr:hypothetical protein [Amycolatopsis rhabdoformis]WSE26141.1 hypothetical protein VSH64_25025 [Amycolatopsis rhabdoformis]